ncbi:MAG: GNAT family N-acetyltransferase [Gaiellaceae bacterium]
MAAEPILAIRAARADEARAVLALWAEGGAEPTTTDDVPALERLLEHDPEALLVAELDGELAGTIVAAWDGWRGSMYRLVVAPALRRQGIGRALVRAAEQRLLALGARRLAVIVVGDEEAATAFWPEVGFRAQSGRRRFVKDSSAG